MNAREAQMVKSMREMFDVLDKIPLPVWVDLNWLIKQKEFIHKLESRYKEDARFKGHEK